MTVPRRFRRLALLVALTILALDARAGLAITLCVNPAGSSGCFASVQQAVDAASSGDVVVIAAGTYVERVDVPPRKRALALRGEGAATTRLVTPDGGASALSVRGPATFLEVSGLTLASETTPTAPVVTSAAQGARLTITDCEVTGGRTGVSAQAKVVVQRSTISGATTRGLIVGHTGTLTLADSTVTGNFTGIDVAERSATVVNSTISGNSAVGIRVWGPIPPNRGGGSLTLRSSTVAANGVTGLVVEGRATLQSSLLADNGSGPDCTTGTRPINLRGPTLIENATGCTLQNAGSLVPASLTLGPLQDNGGPTHTHAISAASGAASVLTARSACRIPDQRGVARSVPCDLGAYEAP